MTRTKRAYEVEKVYVGLRGADRVARVWVQEGDVQTPLPLYLDLWNHSPTGHNWGYGGSGPAQLALALLANATLCRGLAIEYHASFKREIVAKLPPHGWSMSERFILLWVAKRMEDDLGLAIEIALAEDKGTGVDFV